MAQSIILKRSATPGKVPNTSTLKVGEIAINTYDGKIFLNRSGSSNSIQEIITTNVTNTGSISLTQTGSFGELVITQDANVIRDLYVIGDVITNSDLDVSGSISGSSIRIEGSGSFKSLQVNDTLTVNHGETIISGSQLVTNDLTVLGAVNARQFNISVISSSVLFQSGSTKFGDTIDDTHSFTGSVLVSGSINGFISATNGVVSGSSQIIGILDSLNTFSGSQLSKDIILASVTGSYNTKFTTLSTVTASYDSRFATLASVTGSYNTRFTSLASVTGSLISSASTALTTNNSQAISITNLNTFSGSTITRLNSLETETTNLELFTSSINNTIKSKLDIEGVISGSSQLTALLDSRYELSGSGVAAGPNTFDFNLDPDAAGTVNFIEDNTGNTQAVARAGSFDVLVGNTTKVSISNTEMNVTTGSITANYMHLAKYISTAGDLDFNI